MGENSKTSSIEDEEKEDIMEDNWDGNEFTESQIEALENIESSELNKSTATSTTTINTEPVLDNDIVFVGHFVSGTYEGPRGLKETIKQEYSTPEALMEYNKSGEQKIVPVKKVLANIYDVRNVYMADELAELLCGPHGQRYQKNIDMVDKLKKSIVAQKGTECVEESMESEPTTLFERLEQERLEQEKLEAQSSENQKLEAQCCKDKEMEALHHQQQELDVQHFRDEEMEVLCHQQQELDAQCHKDEEMEALCHQKQELDAQHHLQQELEVQHHEEEEEFDDQCHQEEELDAQHRKPSKALEVEAEAEAVDDCVKLQSLHQKKMVISHHLPRG